MTTIVRFPRLAVYFKIGQLVHHSRFGTGAITTIRGRNATIAFCDETRELDIDQVATRVQAEEHWQDCYSHGANRRLEEGRWLWVIRSLCTSRGEWNAFLNKWGIPRSSAFDLIQRFQQERFLETQQSSGNRTDAALDDGVEDHADTLNAGRKRVMDEETTKREGRLESQTAKYIYWNVRIKLSEGVVGDCREKYEQDGADAKQYWVRAANRFVDREDELVSDSDDAEQAET